MKKLKPNHDEGMWKGAPSDSFTKAQFLRRNETKAEKLLWEKLRNNQLEGLKFRRQHPVNIYIADFYCHELKLVIEVDGGYHQTKEQLILDNRRTDDIEFQGLKLIRFTNEEVTFNLEEVLTKIKDFMKSNL